MPKDPNELGALWVKTSAKGDYMTGTINGVPVVLFPNRYKEPGDNKPDWRVLKSQPKDGSRVATKATGDITLDDVPFAWLLPIALPMAGLIGLGVMFA